MKTIIKFEAPWCAACKHIEQGLYVLAELHGVGVIHVNVEEEAATAKEYGIRQLPTLVLVDGNEEEIDRTYNLLGLRQMLDIQKTIDKQT